MLNFENQLNGGFANSLMTLFSLDLFRQMANNQPITLFQLNIITGMLVERGVPFDVSFVPGNGKTAPSFQLTIHINPTATAVFVITLTPGPSTFTPSP
jgi:hypothetical protein